MKEMPEDRIGCKFSSRPSRDKFQRKLFDLRFWKSKTGRAGSPLPVERVNWQPAARTE